MAQARRWRPAVQSTFRLLLAVVLLALLALAPQAAFAHADLARSDPAAGTVLDQSPKRVTIWFTEPIEPGYSDIRVLESSGGRVDQADSAVDPGDPTALSVSLASLPPGIYTVAWRNTSKADGHGIQGSFAFSVKQPLSGQDFPKQQAPPLFSSPFEPFLRWTSLLGAMALPGGLAFLLLVVRPSLGSFPEAYRKLRSRIGLLLWVATGLLFLSEIGRLLIHASTLNDLPVSRVFGGPVWAVLADTDWGHLWLWRLALTGAFAMLAGFSGTMVIEESQDGPGEQPRLHLVAWLLLALGMGILLTMSLSSHGAALAGLRAAGVFTDYVHLLAAAFWVGGLLHLAAGLPLLFRTLSPPRRGLALSALVRRFSTLAILAAGTLVITGLYSAWALVGTWPALPRTAYGKDLIAKLALLVPLLALAAMNFFWIGPRLAQSTRAAPRLRRIVTCEARLAVALILTVGVLTTLEPARQEAARIGIGQPAGLSFQAMAGDLHVGFSVSPGQIGNNRLIISLKDHNGRPVTGSADVTALLRYIGKDLGAMPVTAVAGPDGTYEVGQALLTIAGPWQAELLVRRPGSFDTPTTFQFTIPPAGSAATQAWAPSPDTGRLLFGVELLALGLLFAGVAPWRVRWRSRAGAAILSAGGVMAMIGAALIVQAVLGGRGQKDPEINPFPPTEQSVSMGRELYQQYCQLCHGTTGKGDGPAAASLVPQPFDLTVHGPLHSDGELYRFIAKGVAGTGMPAWNETLTEDQIWHIINYLRVLAPQR